MKKKATSVLVDTKQMGYDYARFIVNTIGKDKAYELATWLLAILRDKRYCIWQTYTMDDLRKNSGKKRISQEQLDDFNYALTNFASIDPNA